jgi:predicted lipid-binding transport protein (Tim44 family)
MAVDAAEIEELLRLARLSFVAMQAAWDRADLPALSALALSPLAAEFKRELDARGDQTNHTEVLALDARLLSWEELSEACVASVEFSGLIRERTGDAASPFREMWLLARIKRGGLDWKLARVQALC